MHRRFPGLRPQITSAIVSLGICLTMFLCRGWLSSPAPAHAATRQTAGEPETLTAHRARIVLDGKWRFQPSPTGGPAGGSAWGSLGVPGTWGGATDGLDSQVMP